jgi:hypothetical protein
MTQVMERPRRKRLFWESRCEIVALIEAGMSPYASATDGRTSASAAFSAGGSSSCGASRQGKPGGSQSSARWRADAPPSRWPGWPAGSPVWRVVCVGVSPL